MSFSRQTPPVRRYIQISARCIARWQSPNLDTKLPISSTIDPTAEELAETAILAAESALAKSGRTLAMTRHDTFGAIARILSEISEPVELVRASLDMMRSKAFADNPRHAESVLRLASENTELVKTLLDNLRGLSDIALPSAKP